jgi:S-adenosyl methyltransferase
MAAAPRWTSWRRAERTTRALSAAGGIDASVAHQARVYDYRLGGKDNFAVDREAAELAPAAYPGLRRGVHLGGGHQAARRIGLGDHNMDRRLFGAVVALAVRVERPCSEQTSHTALQPAPHQPSGPVR